MFKKASVGVVALTYLSEDVKALKTKYRPYEGTAPWHKEVKDNTWHTPDWNVNYFVPNFGVDKDVLNTQKHLSDSEEKIGHKLFATFKKTEDHPKDYFVPNFGPDENDVKLTQSNIAEAESELGHKFQADFKKPGPPPPKDYFVPNFGVDQDIKDNHKNLADAEKALNHKFQQNFVKPKDHPKNYFVPDFGLDEDIVGTQASIAQQESIHGPWVPKQDENGVWIVPQAAKGDSYSYKGGKAAAPTPAPAASMPADFIPELGFLQLRDDPICSSADPNCN